MVVPRTKTAKMMFEVVAGEPAPFRCTRDAIAWCREHGVIGRLGAGDSGGKGVVTISADCIRESLNPRQRAKSISDEIHFAAVMRLRELIRASVILEEHPDWRKDAAGNRVPVMAGDHDITVCLAYGALRILGVVYRVRLTLKRYAQTRASKAYAYRVNEIEVLSGTLGGRPKLATNPTGTTSICGNILLYGASDVNGMPITFPLKVVSGGQTGVDQGGLEAAVDLGLAYGGWAPHGWIAERRPDPSSGLENGRVPSRYRKMMREYADCGSHAQNYRERTKANIRDSHATLILVNGLPLTGGTLLTRNVAAAIMRPHCVIDMALARAKEDALKWLRQFLGLSSEFVLNIAGSRESKSPGIQARTREFLKDVFLNV